MKRTRFEWDKSHKNIFKRIQNVLFLILAILIHVVILRKIHTVIACIQIVEVKSKCL